MKKDIDKGGMMGGEKGRCDEVVRPLIHCHYG